MAKEVSSLFFLGTSLDTSYLSDGDLRRDHLPASLYHSHFKEMGSRLELARKQGQETAELKKLGEIKVLKNELGQKSRYV